MVANWNQQMSTFLGYLHLACTDAGSSVIWASKGWNEICARLCKCHTHCEVDPISARLVDQATSWDNVEIMLYKESIIPALEYPEHGIMIQWGHWGCVGSDPRHIKEQQECIKIKTLHLLQDVINQAGYGYSTHIEVNHISSDYIWPYLVITRKA